MSTFHVEVVTGPFLADTTARHLWDAIDLYRAARDDSSTTYAAVHARDGDGICEVLLATDGFAAMGRG
jgi:hypothetical protein